MTTGSNSIPSTLNISVMGSSVSAAKGNWGRGSLLSNSSQAVTTWLMQFSSADRGESLQLLSFLAAVYCFFLKSHETKDQYRSNWPGNRGKRCLAYSPRQRRVDPASGRSLSRDPKSGRSRSETGPRFQYSVLAIDR